jgi:predicted ATP-dependent Lon-type protease
MDALDQKLVSVFNGKVVRKDLLHRIKTGTNVPTFVLEFLLARYCASDDPAEIQAGMEAVLATLQDHYVRPDEANAAQSKVAPRANIVLSTRYTSGTSRRKSITGLLWRILIRNVLPSGNDSTGRTIACWRVASGRK